MNAERRKQIEILRTKLDDAKSEIEILKDAEQESYDNMPESFQCGERGDKSQTAIDALDSAAQSLEEATTYLEEAGQ